jgi:hypothetical protein
MTYEKQCIQAKIDALVKARAGITDLIADLADQLREIERPETRIGNGHVSDSSRSRNGNCGF